MDYYQDDWSEWLPMVDFTAAALPHESTGLPPSQIDNGYVPRTSFDWQSASPPRNLKIDRRDAQAFVRRMEEIWNMAKAGMEHAQAKQKKQADQHRREVDFQVGDEVMVTTKD